MTDTVKAELDRVVEVLVGTGIVTKIILFGSHARGDGNPNSDIDLCVLTSVKDKRPIDVTIELRGNLIGVRKSAVDLFALEQNEFYNHAKRPTSFHYEILNNGVTLYDNG
ncbi:MAG: nucleotidyltransferase domain-containing protein [Chitinispirillales bacterium]|jgi:predicted nucleotidyltransferase|nr:nucleotidyltransferase domain-containing protein [Chitinispirillales bacterium]